MRKRLMLTTSNILFKRYFSTNMKAMKTIWMILLGCIISTGLAGCSDAEEGEKWGEWEIRNAISGAEKRILTIENEKGEWVDAIGEGIIYFSVKFSASPHTFASEKFYYKDGEADETTREKYSAENNTAYTIKDKVVECTVDGKPYFRMTVIKVGYNIECQIYFYEEDRTFHAALG